MENLYLIVGLGNPGREYFHTRHNAGFLVVERLADRWKALWTVDRNFKARLARVDQPGRRILLCQPLTYMNASGETVGAIAAFYKLGLPQVVIVVDDADLPFGEIRLRPQGSSGGHHGLESIEQQLSTRDYGRQRIGIGRTADGQREITGHVLARFSAAESRELEKVLTRAADQIECWLNAGIEQAMNQFNGTVDKSEKGTE
ncbi:MAG TPA: aminoacyl-tRNA hydrolase [Verrucomicrobiae bacterium]